MSVSAYIQAEDLGLTVLGTAQVSYTVDGVHNQDYDTAVYKAALCRSTALEEVLASYTALIKKEQTKIDDLGTAIASVNRAIAAVDDPKTDTEITIGSSVASLLRRYGFSTASSKMTYADLTKLVKNVQYAMDTENNNLQQNMTQLQNFVSKRDDAMQMAQKLMKKVATTRKRGISYIGS